MNLRKYCKGIMGAVAVLIAGLFVTSANAAPPYPKVSNVSPNPAGTNEFYLTATNMTVANIGGTNVQVRVYMDDPPGGGGAPAGLPCPMVEANVGTMIICHFKNNLVNNVEGESIHWHGIELNNDSDGTAVTQDSIMPGQTYVYKFIVPRAGLFWYHSHMIPGTSTFNGMYGPIIVTNSNEALLVSGNILPTAQYTFPLLLSDISFTNGVPGKVIMGTNYPLNTLIQLCENNALGTNQGDQTFCGPAGVPGNIVLVNGFPPALAGSFSNPNGSSTPIYTVANNSRVRLQLFNASISRDFNMSLHYPSGDAGDTNLYRVGGQGGFLDNAILDGGVQSNYPFMYNQGSIVLGTGMRADVMFYPSGANGKVIELVGNPLPAPWNLSEATAPGVPINIPANYPIAFFVITNTGTTNLPLANGSPILTGIGQSNQNLKTLALNTLIPPPAPSEGVTPGGDFITPSGSIVPLGTIVFENGMAANATTNHGYTPAGPNMNGYAATALDGNMGNGTWLDVPHPPSAIWARAGDVLQLTIINDVDIGGGGSVHPFHLHGFAMQPISILSADLQTNLYTFNYNEFLDTIEVYPGQAVVFRIQLTDRPTFADTATGGPVTVGVDAPTGGNVGRWLMHCHIFLHGTIGMISELDVVPNTLNLVEGPAAGSDSAILWGSAGAWTATANASWLHLSAANKSGTGSTNVIFTYDANSGATRTGTLTLAGETVNVTQAGSTYVQAPGPVTTLASTTGSATAVAVDGAGNVYFCDDGAGKIKEWTVANNKVTTLVSGLSQPQYLALDSLGNVYFTQFGSNTVTEWSAASQTLTTVPFSGLFFSGLSQPEGVAVDAAGNVYVADPSQNAIYEWVAFENIVNTLVSSGLNGPYGVAVDAAGNVYIADTGNNAIKERLAASGSVITLVSSNSTTPLDNPWSLAVDGGGNVYIADGFDDAIKEWSPATKTVTTLVSGLGDPTGVAVDASQDVYIADINNKAVKELPYAFVDTSDIVVNGTAATHGVSVVVPATANLGPPFTLSSDASWVTITGGSNGLVDFSITANAGGERLSTITVLGETIGVVQDGPSFSLGTSALVQGPAAGSNSVVLSVVPNIGTWSASSFVSWMHLGTASSNGTGSTNVIFSVDANPGATRSGDIDIGSLSSAVLLSVTQAGSTYVQAPGPVTTLASTTGNAVAVAVDGSGNVYFCDGDGEIKKWAVANNHVTTLVSGLVDPQGVAVDAAGNVYFSDSGSSSVMEWSVVSNSVTSLPISGLSQPAGLAVDGAGNVYIADIVNIKIWKYVPPGGQGSSGALVNSGLTAPYGVAVDVAGNVYIADNGDSTIKEWTAANKTLSTVVSGLGNPTGVAVDGSQNVYIADFENNAIKERPYAFVDPTTISVSGGAATVALPVVLPDTENLLSPFAPTDNTSWLTIGGITNGVVSVEVNANTGSARNGLVKVLGENIPFSQSGPTFSLGTSSLLEGPASGTDSVVLAMIPATAAWSASSQASWLHLSAANENGTGSTNVIFTYDANSGATRTGSLTIGGQTLTVTQAGTTYVQAPGPLTALASGLAQPYRLAVDGSGNVYFSDRGDGSINKWTAANNKVTSLVTNGLSLPAGVAVDGAGNVYFADTGNSAIKEWTVADGKVTTVISNGLTFPLGLALDGAGNIYFSSASTGTIAEWTVANSNLTTLVSGLTDNFGLAVDAAGNVYIAENSSGQIQEWIASSGNLITLISGDRGPQDVAVDGSGNLYFANSGNDEVKEWTATTGTVSTVASGLGDPTGVAVDGAGNVYFADNVSNVVEEQPYAFVDPTPVSVGDAAVTIALPVVLPATANILSPFAPSDNTSWLTITGIANDVVDVKVNANNTTATRTGEVTLLGQNIPFTQAGVVPPPKITNAKLLSNGKFQFSFTNANLDATFTVLFTTNLDVPLANWIPIGTASNLSPGVFQFTTTPTNSPRFYTVRSP